MQPSDEVKSKLDIVDVLREYIQLKPAGTSFRAVCPFHHEKTPSFMVSPEKQIWHCFGCGKGGDIFSFVMEMEGIDFPEALKQLANKAGVKLARQDPKLVSAKNRISDIVDLSSRYYHKVFTDSREAQGAREYLSGRGVTEDTIEEWQLGYSPDSWDDLIKFLQGRGFKEDEIFRAGMSVKKEKMSGFYNRFRGRIMFPLSDVNGSIVGFSARILPAKDDGKMGKYINSPQTAIYDKSRLLFGLDKAKQEIKKQDVAILVEGQMDVITAHQHGFKNVIASSGTALTPEQIGLLKRYTQNIALAFDMDKAGEMAAERGIKVALNMDMNIRVIEVPNGKDPDECIKNDPEGWKKAVASAKPMMQYYLDKNLEGADLTDIDKTSRVAVKILTMIADISSKIKQDHWLKILSEKIDKTEPALREELARITSNKKDESPRFTQKSEEEPIRERPKTREEKLSESVIALILKFPQLLESAVKRLHPDHLAGKANQSLYRSLVIYYNNLTDKPIDDTSDKEDNNLKFADFRQWLQTHGDQGGEEFLGYLDMIALLGERDLFDYDPDEANKELMGVILALKKNDLSVKMKEMEKAIAQAEKKGDSELVNGLLREFKALADESKGL